MGVEYMESILLMELDEDEWLKMLDLMRRPAL